MKQLLYACRHHLLAGEIDAAWELALEAVGPEEREDMIAEVEAVNRRRAFRVVS